MSFGEPFLSKRYCPCCEKADSAKCVASIPAGETLRFDELRDSWFGFFKKKVFFTYDRCKRCAQLFNPYYFTDEALVRLYAKMPDNTAGISQQHLERTQKGYFEFLKSFGAINGDFMELGPDIGLFTQFCVEEVGIGKLWLFEPNVSVHGELGRRVQGRQFTIRTEMSDFSAVPDGSLGVCVLIHVLDHLPNARLIVKEIVRKLHANGKLLIVTHDETSLLARILGKRWPAYCLQHPHLFNRQSTLRFLSECGLKVLKTKKTTNYFPLAYLLKHLAFALGVKTSSTWKETGIIMPLKLGNIISVAVRQSVKD